MGAVKKITGESYEIVVRQFLPATDAQLENARAMVAQLEKMVIVDDAGLVAVDALLTKLKAERANIEAARVAEKSPVDGLAKDIQAKYKPAIDLAEAAIAAASKKIIKRQQEKQAEIDRENARLAAIAAEAERKRREELERQAQAQREKEAAARKEAERLQAMADKEKNEKKRLEMEAEALRQQQAADRAALQAADREQKKEEVYVPAQQVMQSAPALNNAMRDNWDAEITNLMEFVKAVAAAIIPLTAIYGIKKDKDTGKVTSPALSSMAGSVQDTMQYPGVRFFNNKTLAKTRATKAQVVF